MPILKKLKDLNQESIEETNSNLDKRKRRDDLLKGQHPSSIIISCSDSRVIPEHIFKANLGELFVIRTAGNVINGGELASIEYGIEHLKCELVIVMGHTHCGAIHASIHNEKGRYLAPIISRIRNNIVNETDEIVAAITNAEKEVEFLKGKFPEFKGKIVPALFDLKTGKVEFFE